MKVELVTNETDFRSLEEIWNPLLSRSGTRNIFLTFEWLSTWWKHFGDRHGLSIVVVRRGGEIVGLFPLMKTVREGFRQLGMISNKIIDYKDFIIDAEQDRVKVIRAMLDAMMESGGWDLLLLNGFPEDSVNFDAFKTALGHYPGNRVVWRDSKVALSVPLEKSYDDYFKSLRKSFRRNISDGQRRLTKEVKSFSYDRELMEDKLEYRIDKVIDLNAVRWREVKGQYSAFEDPSMRSFYKDLARRLLPKGWINITTMYINDEIASMNLCFRHGGKYFGLINSYDGRFSRYSLGSLQILHVIKSGFEDGLTELDFLSGDESYKYLFNPKEKKMYTIGLFRRGATAYVAYRWFFGIRPVLERMEQSPMKKLYWWYRQRSVRNG